MEGLKTITLGPKSGGGAAAANWGDTAIAAIISKTNKTYDKEFLMYMAPP